MLRWVLLLAAAGTAMGCGKKEDKPAVAVVAPPAPAAPPREARFLLSASANDAVWTTLPAGCPIVFQVGVFLKPGAAPLTLSTPGGRWADALKVECRAPGGVDRSSDFVPCFASNPTIELTEERSGMMVWILKGAPLAEGTWNLRAALDGIPSPVVEVAVKAPTAGDAQKICMAAMNAASWENDLPKGLAAADAHLAAHPKDIPVLFMKGHLLFTQGKKTEALAALQASLDAAGKGEHLAIQRAIAELQSSK
jgi:hypothetical protein